MKFLCVLLFPVAVLAQKQVLDTSLHHLRQKDSVEWDEFRNSIPKRELVLNFNARANPNEQTLILRQYDVKQVWRIGINNTVIDSLLVDGNYMRTYFRIPAGLLRDGQNQLSIFCVSNISDDIVVSDIEIDERPRNQVLAEGFLRVEVVEKDHDVLLASRITVVDQKGSLQTMSAASSADMALRPGMAYSKGFFDLQLPAGNYNIYATRGFEYGVDSADINVAPGQTTVKQLSIRHEVKTPGWISCDTHIHTLTYSGHGDATDVERLITIAGEGLEMPVITEHNLITDLRSITKKYGFENYFTPLAGDEVTTPVGHFNYFPLDPASKVPDHRVNDWQKLIQNLGDTTNKIIILNHARDVHNGFRPSDKLPLQWILPANAMELINSGALLSDKMQLVKDWFRMLDNGFKLTPIGGSDSHDVGRYIVGQARTYIQTRSDNPARIDVNEVIANMKAGKVSVSFGLLSQIIVNGKYGPGETVFSKGKTIVDVKVLGPSWVTAERVSLFLNGEKVREERIKKGSAAGIKWKGRWKLPRLKKDSYLVVIAEGNDINLPYWPVVKPYQATTTYWHSYTMGISGAVYIKKQ